MIELSFFQNRDKKENNDNTLMIILKFSFQKQRCLLQRTLVRSIQRDKQQWEPGRKGKEFTSLNNKTGSSDKALSPFWNSKYKMGGESALDIFVFYSKNTYDKTQ